MSKPTKRKPTKRRPGRPITRDAPYVRRTPVYMSQAEADMLDRLCASLSMTGSDVFRAALRAFEAPRPRRRAAA